ncbi:MAG TPA: hypothetical protein P5531_01850 [Bacteroidales bacterium]|nr:hypothetical protein [Bacteroidales bacterium]HSA43037.1 hypothetical protein [Bacteroidales bacterium]
MKQKKPFRHVILSIPLISLSLSAITLLAGNEAGPDKNTCLKPDGTAIPVQIGSKGIEGYCYYWEPSTGLNNWFISNPTASPSVTTTYTLYVSGENFSYSAVDQVTVTVGTVDDFSITPKFCCYKTGETLIPEMFDITTTPPGLDHLVSFFPPVIMPQNQQMYYTSTHGVSIGCASGPNYQVSLPAVDESITEELGVQLPANLTTLQEKFIDNISDAINKFYKFRDNPIIPLICAPDLTVTNNFSVARSKKCCDLDNNCAISNYLLSFSPKICGEFACDFPFFGIPYIASANVSLSAGICGGVSANYETGCSEKKLCFSISPEVTVGGGISGTVLNGSVLKASLQVVATSSVPDLQVCFGTDDPPKGSGNYCVKLDVVGEVKLISFVTKKVSRELIPQTCGNPFIN